MNNYIGNHNLQSFLWKLKVDNKLVNCALLAHFNHGFAGTECWKAQEVLQCKPGHKVNYNCSSDIQVSDYRCSANISQLANWY